MNQDNCSIPRDVLLVRQGLGLTAYIPSAVHPLADDAPGLPPSRGLRGQITEFSRQSRKRLKQFCAGVLWLAVPYLYFGTFTFADRALPSSPGEIAKRVEAFKRRFYRAFPRPSGLLLVRDYGAKNGRLHFHCLMWSWRPVSREEIMRVWSYADRSAWDTAKSWERLQPGEECLRSIRYVAKYCGKSPHSCGGSLEGAGGGPFRGGPEHLEGAAGGALSTDAHNRDVSEEQGGCPSLRWWYCWQSDDLPAAPVEGDTVPVEVFCRLRRLVRRLQVAKVRSRSPYWGFHDRKALRKDIAFRGWALRQASQGTQKGDAARLADFNQGTERLKQAASIAGYRASWVYGHQGRQFGRNLCGFFLMDVGIPPLGVLLGAVGWSWEDSACSFVNGFDGVPGSVHEALPDPDDLRRLGDTT